MSLHRRDLQKLAVAKADDAELLFQNGRYSNAYYLFGYAAEMALKARIAGMAFAAEAIPDKRFVNDVYTHDLNKLAQLAGLAQLIRAMREAEPVFDANWATVSEWTEQSRYEVIDVFLSTAMRSAMVEGEFGVFQWLQNNW